MSFEYFYGGQSEAFSFYRIPRRLVTGSEFRHLSTEAKLLYSLLLDRMGLSAQNEWYDDQGRVYIYYTVEEIMEDLCCGHGKAGKLLAELDTSKGIGLIERRKQGQGKPTMIYVKQFVEQELPALPRPPKSGGAENRKPEVKTADNRRSGQPKNEGQDIRKSDANYTDSNYTKNSYIDPSNPLSGCSETERAEIEEDTREQISYATMWEKLQEIADNYNLSLHWERTPILGDWDQQRERGKYEDGSFTVTVAHQFGIYSLYLERAGSLPCDDMTAGSTDEYEEWEYTNAHGQSVSIAMRDVSTNVSWSQFDYLIFYSDNDATMTVKTTYGHSLNDNNSDDKAYAERLADSIDFASLSSVKLPEDALTILKGD